MAYAVAQISDLHIVGRGQLLADAIDTAAYLRAAVQHLNGLDPQPDAILATGDLVDGGSTAEYESLAELVSPLRAPLWFLPGNHDDRDPLRAAFARRTELTGDAYVQYVIEGPVRVVCLDSARLGQPGGDLDTGQLQWLDERLAEK